MRNNADLLNQIAELYRKEWGDNAVEALVGVLSTVCTDEQLNKLVELKRLVFVTKNNEYAIELEDINVRQTK